VLRPETVRDGVPGSAADERAAVDLGRPFAATVSFGGIRLASAAAALAAGNASGAGGDERILEPAMSEDETQPRPVPRSEISSFGIESGNNARIDGRLSVSGQTGKTASRVGDGAVRVSGGKVVNIPVLVALLRLSNLQFPASQDLDYFQSEFTLSGNTVTFNRLAALSESVAVLGEGTLTLPELTLDLTLASRGREVRIPLLTGLFESLRDEIFSARIGGTLGAPTLSAESLSGTRRLFTAANRSGSGTPISAEQRLRDIERQARRSVTTGAVLRPEPE